MRIVNIGEQNSILNNFIAEIRDRIIQKDSFRFRRNLERIGEIFAYEISKDLEYTTKSIQTPLGVAACNTLSDSLVLASIIRAGLPLHNGLLSFFDASQNAFVAAYRKYGKDNKFTIQIEYTSTPSVEGKVLILADTMLATGSSVPLAYNRLCDISKPKHSHIVCPIASVYGIEYLSKHLPLKETTLWGAAVDEELTVKSYIVPGLGDAGALAYGSNL
jgi:uracil phosphoribosyltransferase